MSATYRIIYVIDDLSLYTRIFKAPPKQRKGVLVPGPFTLKEAQTALGKLMTFPWRRNVIQEIGAEPS